MNGVCARPLLQFFERLAEVVQNLAVDEFDLSLRGLDRKEGGNPIDDLAKGGSWDEADLLAALETA